jgi:hypothetical protein
MYEKLGREFSKLPPSCQTILKRDNKITISGGNNSKNFQKTTTYAEDTTRPRMKLLGEGTFDNSEKVDPVKVRSFLLVILLYVCIWEFSSSSVPPGVF